MVDGSRSALARAQERPLSLGVLVALALVAICTGIIYPLKLVTAVESLGVVYLLGVVIVSAFWGLWLGLATSVLSAAAFNFFHLPPIGHFTIADNRNWVALGAFLVRPRWPRAQSASGHVDAPWRQSAAGPRPT